MSLIQWATTAGTKALLKDGEKDGKTKWVAETADNFINGFFPDDPKGIKLFFVTYMLIPIGKFLTRETPNGWEKALSGKPL